MPVSELEPRTTESSQSERQIVAFRLGDETYGVDIGYIHTIIMPQPITAVPRAPKFVKGVMNLRGRVLPVIDLRLRFGMQPAGDSSGKDSRIVIVDVDGLAAGLVVDSVSEVMRLSTAAIDPPSQLVCSVETECIVGIGKVAGTVNEAHAPVSGRVTESDACDRLIILLDVYKTLVTCAKDAKTIKSLQG